MEYLDQTLITVKSSCYLVNSGNVTGSALRMCWVTIFALFLQSFPGHMASDRHLFMEMQPQAPPARVIDDFHLDTPLVLYHLSQNLMSLL